MKRAFKESSEILGGAGCNDVNSKYVLGRDEEEKLQRRKEGRKEGSERAREITRGKKRARKREREGR